MRAAALVAWGMVVAGGLAASGMERACGAQQPTAARNLLADSADGTPIPAAARARFDSVDVTQLAPGVAHVSGRIGEGPWLVNVIVADLADESVSLEAVRAGSGLIGRERTSVLAGEWEDAAREAGRDVVVLAAVNADFFDLQTGEQRASQVSDGRVLKALPSPAGAARWTNDASRPQLLVDSGGRPHVVHGEYAGVVIAGERHIALDGVNARPGYGGGLVLFDRSWARPLPLDSMGGPARALALRSAGTRGDTLLLLPLGNGVAAIDAPSAGSGDVVLAAGGAARARLAVLRAAGNDTLRVIHRFAPVGEGVRDLVGGRPVLVSRGRSLADGAGVFAGAAPAFSTQRHPRTAIGIGRNGTRVLLVTVDGRQDASVGMSLQELADLMLDLGAFEALNLDGGGSTTAVVRGHVVNSPSDAGGERTVANALLLVRQSREPERN